MVSYFILIIRAFLYTLTSNPILLLAIQFMDGLAAGVFSIISVIVVSDIAKDSGRFNFMQGIMIFCNSVGAALSNLLSGIVAKTYGIDSSLIFLGTIAIIGFLFYGRFMPETRNKTFLQL